MYGDREGNILSTYSTVVSPSPSPRDWNYWLKPVPGKYIGNVVIKLILTKIYPASLTPKKRLVAEYQ